MKRFLVCGGRQFNQDKPIEKALNAMLQKYGPFVLVHGDAHGADRRAGAWAQRNGITVEVYPANWKKYGKKAGPLRNKQMLDTGIDGVVAFTGSAGTANMVSQAQKRGIIVWDLREHK